MIRLKRSLVAAFALIAASSAAAQVRPEAPILLQGAMGIEVNRMLDSAHVSRTDSAGPWLFSHGTIAGHPVVIAKTMMGGTNAAASTAIAIERFHPRAIINTGTAGGHDPSLHNGDIVIGTTSISLSGFRTPVRAEHQGSSSLEWVPFDLWPRPGDNGDNLHHGTVMQFVADTGLLAAAHRAQRGWAGQVVDGVIGTSDMWNQEIDRIAMLHTRYQTAVEEMETASAAQVARASGVPFIGIRVISDNVTNGENDFDPRTANVVQNFVVQVVRAYTAK